MIYRHVFQRSRSMPGKRFLETRLTGAIGYDRIAGYFDSSLFELAGEALEQVQGTIRIICNSDIRAEDVEAAAAAARDQAQRLSFFKHDPEDLARGGTERLTRLARLLSGQGTARLEVRVLPDKAFGLIHGKAGVITYQDGRRTSFLGSANETLAGWALNYELVWEDDSPEACDWVQEEFNRLWEHPLAMPLAMAVVQEIERLSIRKELSFEEWEQTPDPGSVAVEAPVYREQFGLWPHQKYFVTQAWRAHQTYGARFVLADQVGLGKTVQLGMLAQLIALTSEKPVLVLLPKTLMEQWQNELWDLLQVPSARWNGSCWIDEGGYEYPPSGKEPLLACPRKIGLISQGLVIHSPETTACLLNREWSCVIVDEAHRARRRKLPDPAERGPGIRNPDEECNRLYAFLFKLASKTTSMVLATATPVQLHPIEAWDLLYLLSQNNPHVLGDIGSYWLDPDKALPPILGEITVPEDPSDIWPWVKNPFPPSWESPDAKRLRQDQNLTEERPVYNLAFQELRLAARTWASNLCRVFFDQHTPFVRSIIRRTRAYLENTINPATKEPYLVPIGIELYGETEPIPLVGYLNEAYESAEEFCKLLAKRIHAAGFLKTLLLRRIGSSMEAGRKTVEAMIGSSENGISEESEDYEGDEAYQDTDNQTLSALYPLTQEEKAILERCKSSLQFSEGDPKLEVILEYLQTKGWAQEGCILFSQYYDTAYWVATHIAQHFQDKPIGLYAGSGKSMLIQGNRILRKDREELKRMVKNYELTILVGTDAASEGLNLQSLGTLINIDLPWNPTRLEQRKGRIQRIGQKRASVKILNLRYQDSIEDRVHEVLAQRLEDIYKLFGQIPDVLEDVWIDIALGEKEKVQQELDRLPKINPFDERYSKMDQTEDWETCAGVLNRIEKLALLKKAW
uniref:Helicase SNF2 n=1 Tax=Gracilinema caldarium TaxID=215591 RepID=A0A7C3I1V0_9SPIR